MTADEQAFVDQVDRAVLDLEGRQPSVGRLRSIPMDLVAVAVMKQLARDGAAMPFSVEAIEQAITSVASRN